VRFQVLPNAERDLDEIFVFWAEKAGVQAADKLIDSIIERFWILGQFPKAGQDACGIAPDVRRFPAGEYLIYYRISRRIVDIIHIFHGARDQRRAFETVKKRT
jgi:toxin ParE1/3/4